MEETESCEMDAYHTALMFLRNARDNICYIIPNSREVNLAKTKTDEAIMWLEKAEA